MLVVGGSDIHGGCAGKCGSTGAGYAKDCLKHDVCATFKAIQQNDFDRNDGFCYDEDCGDETAQTVLNCFIGRFGPFDKDVVYDKSVLDSDMNAYGWWSYITYGSGFAEGTCYNFDSWVNEQGLPDKDRIANSFEYIVPTSRARRISRSKCPWNMK